MNLSADSVREAQRLQRESGLPVAVTVPTGTAAGDGIAICPAQLSKAVTCETCGLCAMPERKSIIGFLAHGSKAKAVDERLLQGGDAY